ncbi:spermidine/putrescine ABC transporter substrate-binding protein [Vibrio albus]|uniref:Spermidine/putrescine ABC transporter substrate-binding protein n=1 Tax=Vibrio albus TaxID=2200953 RepID=A0A2U3B951_9VIBR|nr:spermidine/putrescine ABC transporter substrate-binding protein [Vibrio albus]PWI33312.1 spermidine/putrescine ABC transporter substrate-binding protein [Vibrio albus]
MNKKIALFLLCFLGGISSSFADEIRIYTWEDYFSEEVLRQFEKETGHVIKQVYFESEKLRDEVISSSRGESYDLFIMDGYTLSVFASNGVLNKIDFSTLKNTDNIDPKAIQACGSYGVPYTWGTMGIGYRENKVPGPVRSWNDLFNYAKEHKNTVMIPLDDIDTIAVALLALGYNPMEEDESALKEAYQLLSEAKGNLLDFRTANSYVMEKGEASELDMAVVYSGEVYSIAKDSSQDDWKYTVPEEGSLIWYECFASVAQRPLNEASLMFLDFISRPDIAAKNAEEIWFSTANQAALELVSDDYLQDEELFPDAETLSRSTVYKPIGTSGLRLRNRIISVLDKD